MHIWNINENVKYEIYLFCKKVNNPLFDWAKILHNTLTVSFT